MKRESLSVPEGPWRGCEWRNAGARSEVNVPWPQEQVMVQRLMDCYVRVMCVE